MHYKQIVSSDPASGRLFWAKRLKFQLLTKGGCWLGEGAESMTGAFLLFSVTEIAHKLYNFSCLHDIANHMKWT